MSGFSLGELVNNPNSLKFNIFKSDFVVCEGAVVTFCYEICSLTVCAFFDYSVDDELFLLVFGSECDYVSN